MDTATPDRATMNGKPVFTVPASSVINFNSRFDKKLLCDALTFTTGDACAYDCAFCYVPEMFRKLPRIVALKEAHGLSHGGMAVRRANALEILRSQLVHKSGKPRFADPNDRRVIYASPTVDVAANMDLVRETVGACRLILMHTNWQIRLLSKSHLLPQVARLLMAWAEGRENDISVMPANSRLYDRIKPLENFEVFPEHVKARMIFGVSTGTLDDDLAAAFERGTARVAKRLASLHWLQDHGFRTFGMICPSLPMAGALSYHHFARGAFDAIQADKCEHVWAEVINVRGESMHRTCAALRAAGFGIQADLVEQVSGSQAEWERYNRETFLAHRDAFAPNFTKLRYLTYVTKETKAWWEPHVKEGAVLL